MISYQINIGRSASSSYLQLPHANSFQIRVYLKISLPPTTIKLYHSFAFESLEKKNARNGGWLLIITNSGFNCSNLVFLYFHWRHGEILNALSLIVIEM